ncbi:MAG TPA: DUF481 domain-containing protein [Tepidisphaeraceae bacterium]|jgi:putative salt-induced outer membrane protein YdiY|nr:DUF481 domain-containing protein [Tepidisphaeraceae bacterium]
MSKAVPIIRAVSILGFMLALGHAGQARADEILLTNGDRLTGKVVSAGGGKLKIATAMAGEVTVDMANVRSFSTDEPIELHLTDGTILKQRVEAADDAGSAVRTTDGVLGPQTLPLASINQINPPPPPPVKWTGSVRAAAAFSRGNSFTDAFSLEADAVRRSERVRRTLGAAYAYGRERIESTGEKNTTEDEWFAYGKYDYYLSKKVYLYGLGKVEQDRAADLLVRVSPSVGVGYQWIESPTFNIHTEAGFGWQYERYENGETEGQYIARFAYHIDRKFWTRYSIFHDMEVLPSLEDIESFNVNTNAGLRVALTQKLFTEFKVVWEYDSTPAPNASKHDVDYLLSVGYSF